MVAQKIDLIDQLAVEIGSDYQQNFKICGLNLADYSGECEVKLDPDAETLLTVVITIVGNDILTLSIPNASYPINIESGIYNYDILLTHKEKSTKKYLMYGEIEIIQRITS